MVTIGARGAERVDLAAGGVARRRGEAALDERADGGGVEVEGRRGGGRSTVNATTPPRRPVGGRGGACAVAVACGALPSAAVRPGARTWRRPPRRRRGSRASRACRRRPTSR